MRKHNVELLLFYVLTGFGTVLFFASLVYVFIGALWLGGADILVPIRLSFLYGLILFVLASVYSLTSSFSERKLLGLFFGTIAIIMLIGFLWLFLKVATDFLFGAQFTFVFYLISLDLNVRILSTIGVAAVSVFVAISLVTTFVRVKEILTRKEEKS